MKKIGLIGGMSWESTQVYYQYINRRVRDDLGGFHSARCILESVDFATIECLQHKGDWHALTHLMVECARTLEKAGAEVILLCTNTMHICSPAITESVSIPLLHIAHTTGSAVKNRGIRKVLLLGTKFTMEKEFFKQILKDSYDLEIITPNERDRERVHAIIFNELVQGNVNSKSREFYKEIISKSIGAGAEGVILGCTEIPLLIDQSDSPIPVFDTTRIHAECGVQFALS